MIQKITSTKVKLQKVVDPEVADDLEKIANGADFNSLMKALLAICIKHEEAPFGVWKDEES